VGSLHTFHNPDRTDTSFGAAVAMSGDEILISAPQANVASGVVYLYGTSGRLLHTFRDPNGSSNDVFGAMLAFSGSNVLIGAPGENNGDGTVYLFNTYGQLLQTFQAPDPTKETAFGAELAVTAAYVLVGASGQSGATSAAYLFNTSGQLLHSFSANNQAYSVGGNWVALSGTEVLVGSQDDNGQTGAVNLYDTSGQLLRTFVDPGGRAGDFFGVSMALAGNDVAVGAVGDQSGNGAVYLYNTSGQLLQTFKDPGDTKVYPYFASAVGLSGNFLLVGAREQDGSTGAAYLYSTSGKLLRAFHDPKGASGDGFGQSVALSGTKVLVAANDAAQLNRFPGAAYLYSVRPAHQFGHTLFGSIAGTFVIPPTTPDVGLAYILSGSGRLGVWGDFQATAELSTPGNVVVSTAGGTLNLSNPAGTLTLWLESMPISGGSLLPQEFDYGVRSATGIYAGASVQGTISIVLTPASAQSTDSLPQYGTFTLTIHAGAVTSAGIKGVVLAGTQPQRDVLVTARAYGQVAVTAWAVTDYQGLFQLFLPPGKYFVQATGLLLQSTLETVIVPKHGYSGRILAVFATLTGHHPKPPALYAGDRTYDALVGQALTADASSGLLSETFDRTGWRVEVTAINGKSANVGTKIVLNSGATLTVRANGSFVYTPKGDSQYGDIFTFTVSDGRHTVTATASINGFTPWMYVHDADFVTPAGQSLIVPPAVGLLAGLPPSKNSSIHITEVNGSAANLETPITLASGATLTVNADGSFSYVPAAGFSGQDSFKISGDEGEAFARTVTIFVAPAG
jgi:hypothetical protein